MEFLLAILFVVAGVFLKYAKNSIKLNPDEKWTPAREVKQDEGSAETAGAAKEAESAGGRAESTGNRTGNAEKRVGNAGNKTTAADRAKSAGSEADEAGSEASEARPAYGTVPRNGVKAVYGLIGKPLGHSRSMIMFKKKFREEGISADYCNFELENAGDVRRLVEQDSRICGLNVTCPYKTDVIQYLDRLDGTAAEIGAVNVIKIVRSEGRVELVGFNTDTYGFRRALEPILPDTPVKALVLGTGGASKAVCHALKSMGLEYDVVSRSSNFEIMGYYELSPSVMEAHRLIVNCTPLGTAPQTDQCPDIPYAYITQDHIMFDLVYNPDVTLFMKKGDEHGATVRNGSEMLRYQAEEAWKIWNE